MKTPDAGDSETSAHSPIGAPGTLERLSPRRKLLFITLIFLTALGVRLLNWQNYRHEALAVQSSVALNYKHQARLIQAYGVTSLYDASSATNDPDLLGHPPGYPILLSLLYRIAGESDSATQLLQTILDSFSVVVIVLVAFEFFPSAVALIAGLLSAFAPQFSWNSLTLLPDSLAALPLLLALLVIAKTVRRRNLSDLSSLLSILGAGALIGISCWLRANALLLAPFLTFVFCFSGRRGARLLSALVLCCGSLLIISALTIRNLVVFDKFIPVSLGAGQTLVEGIADYNTDGSLGLPQTDVELIRGEAETCSLVGIYGSIFPSVIAVASCASQSFGPHSAARTE